MDRRRLRWIGSLGLTALLAACGGGGDDSGGFDGGFGSGERFDARAAWGNLLTTGRTWTASGRANDGSDYVITIATAAPGGLFAFPLTGAAASLSQATLTTRVNSTPFTTRQETYFDAATLRILGLRVLDDTSAACDLVDPATTAAPPSSARVGEGGPLATLSSRSGCTPGLPPNGDTIEVRWSVEGLDGLPFFCVTSTQVRAGAAIQAEKDCVQVAADGTLGNAARVRIERNDGFVVDAR